MATELYPDYNKGQAYTLLFVQIFFIIVLFCMLIHWHYKNPDSLLFTHQLQKELLEKVPSESEQARS